MDATGRTLEVKTVCEASSENAVTTHNASLNSQRTLESFLLEPVAVWPRVEGVVVFLTCKNQARSSACNANISHMVTLQTDHQH